MRRLLICLIPLLLLLSPGCQNPNAHLLGGETDHPDVPRAYGEAHPLELRGVRAMEKGKHEIILTWSGWGLVWLDRLMPAFADRLVARFGK